MEKGEIKKATLTVKRMLLANVSLTQAQIAEFVDVPLEFVKKIADSLKNN